MIALAVGAVVLAVCVLCVASFALGRVFQQVKDENSEE